MCIGINLAYCELYVVLGTIFRCFGNMKDATKFHVTAGEKVT